MLRTSAPLIGALGALATSMADESVDALTFAWLRHASLPPHTFIRDQYSWAYDKLSKEIYANPQYAWKLIVRLIQFSVDDEQLMQIAAGPLEDFLVQHSSEFIEILEEEARSNRNLVKALRGVDISSGDSSMRDRIYALAGLRAPDPNN